MIGMISMQHPLRTKATQYRNISIRVDHLNRQYPRLKVKCLGDVLYEQVERQSLKRMPILRG